MALIEQGIPTIFGGVSRQPHNVRFTGQVQDAENVDFSISTGGISKRRGFSIITKIDGLSPGVHRRVHSINRDVNEKYSVVLSSGSLKVFDQDGDEKTVNLASGGATFLTADPDDFAVVTVIDYTFIVKKTVVVATSSAGVLNDATMPWALIREEDGTFTLEKPTWNTYAGTGTPPSPDFVGRTISDLVFHRNRMGIVAGETTYFSAVGDVFNFWPDQFDAITEADPFGLTSALPSVSKMYFAAPFRKSLFIMGDNAQFEISGSLLTNNAAVIDVATQYSASTKCRPVVVGDELFFPTESENSSRLMSYLFDDTTVSETAEDVTKHVLGFIPAGLKEIVGDSATGQVFCFTEGDTDALYVYRYFYAGTERVQSAWTRYVFDGITIHSIGKVGQEVVMLYDFDGAVWLGSLPIEEEEFSDYTWAPRLDHMQRLLGTYNSGTGRTTWALGYEATDPVAVLSTEFSDPELHMRPIGLTVSGDNAYADGDYSAHDVLVGENFNAFVELSKQYVRDRDGRVSVNGVLKLRYMTLRYSDTGYFEVTVTPKDRDPRTYTYAASVVTAEGDTINQFALNDGKFRFGVKTDGETAKIVISSDKPIPFNITSAAWVGYFNEIALQG